MPPRSVVVVVVLAVLEVEVTAIDVEVNSSVSSIGLLID